jgi:hypothetical protein
MTTPNTHDFILGRLDGKIDQVLVRLSGLDKRLEGAEGRLDSLEEDRLATKTVIRTVAGVGSAVGALVAAAASKAGALLAAMKVLLV